MKTTHTILILLIGAIAPFFMSCSDSAFDKYPTDSMQMETYGKNDSEVRNVLLDSYYYLRTISSNVISINGLATDEAYDNKRNNSNDHIVLNESSWDSQLGMTSTVWTNCYNMINRCNTTLEHLNNVSSTNKALFEGEAKFMRAYAYFTLVRLFGPVPLTTTVIKDYTSLYNYDREPVENIYDLIDSDLATAISNLPDRHENASMVGRATRIASYTLLADAQMTRNDFAGAKITLDNVISYANANPSKLGLESDVKRIYDSTNPIGKEIIFAAQFNDGAVTVSNGFMNACIPNLVPATQTAYTYPDDTESSIKISTGSGTLLMTWELWNKLKENPKDKRLTELVYSKIYDFQSVAKESAEVEVIVVDGASHARCPSTLKYFDFKNEGLTTTRSSCDNIIYRYGGVLLMYAECLNETGKTLEAANYLNQIRNRAGIDDTPASTQAEMRLAIEDESFLELCFEGHRWYNLVRTKRITPVMEAHFQHRTQGLDAVLQACNNGMVVKDANSTTGIPITWKWSGSSAPVLFGIPYDQIQLTNWTQNELY